MHQTNNYLIVGGDGLIGSCLSSYLHQLKQKVVVTTRRTEPVATDQIFFDLAQGNLPLFEQYHYAFLCAGITNTSTCEADPQNTSKVNVAATVAIAKQLLDSGSRVIYISSNTVFDGKINLPHEDQTYQLSIEYGRQKAEVERQLLSLGAGIVIVRITKVVSFKLPIFATILEKLQSGQSCDVFTDLLICPISMNYLCDSLITIATSQLDGVFHLSGVEDMSYAGFASYIAQYIGADPRLVCPTAAKSALFKPQYAQLGMQRTTKLLNIFPEATSSFFLKLISNR